MKRNIILLFLVSFGFFSCSESEARRPKQKSTTNFYKALIEKNKQLIKRENRFIEDYIQKDTLHIYKASTTGFWYTYNKKVEKNNIFPKSEDIVEIEYNITDLQGNKIYKNQKKTYKIDKEDFIPALQNGLKLMKVGETITFVIPSYRAFGVAGDGNKIGVNQTIKSKVTLINIKQIKNED